MDLNKKAKTIIGLSVASIILVVVSFFAIILSVVVPAFNIDAYGTVGVYILVAGIAIGSVIIVVGSILSFVATILILATNWIDTKLQSDRILWGLLAFFLLGPIGNIIFGVQAKNRFQSQSQQNTVLEPEIVA